MAKLDEQEIRYLKDFQFLKQYLTSVNTRLLYRNNLPTSDKKEVQEQNELTLKDNLHAMMILLQTLGMEEKRPLTQDLIKKVANTINKHAMFIKNDYRTLDNDVVLGNKLKIEKAQNIEECMKKLLNKYYTEWDKLDVFQREALFQMEFIRIHPFEDGNGRTSRLLLNYNLIRQGHAPVLLKEEDREEYFKAMDRQDTQWLRLTFEKNSLKEKKLIDDSIQEFERIRDSKIPKKKI